MTLSDRRRSLRLKGYDYAQAGAYFVTICTQGRACLFGDAVDDTICFSAAGQLAAALWNQMPSRFPEVDLDAFVVMPNHIHGIILLSDGATIVGAPHSPSKTGVNALMAGDHSREGGATRAAPTIGNVVGAFKSLFTVEYIQGVKVSGWPRFQGRLWQRNYYEHVIRDEPELARVRCYIDENPLRWAFDDENPQRS
jgi:putative transposase